MNNERTKLKPSEIAGMWGISQETVIRFIKSGDLPAIDISPRRATKPQYLVDVSDLEAFERSRQVDPDVKPAKRTKRKKPAGFKEYV